MGALDVGSAVSITLLILLWSHSPYKFDPVALSESMELISKIPCGIFISQAITRFQLSGGFYLKELECVLLSGD